MIPVDSILEYRLAVKGDQMALYVCPANLPISFLSCYAMPIAHRRDGQWVSIFGDVLMYVEIRDAQLYLSGRTIDLYKLFNDVYSRIFASDTEFFNAVGQWRQLILSSLKSWTYDYAAVPVARYMMLMAKHEGHTYYVLVEQSSRWNVSNMSIRLKRMNAYIVASEDRRGILSYVSGSRSDYYDVVALDPPGILRFLSNESDDEVDLSTVIALARYALSTDDQLKKAMRYVVRQLRQIGIPLIYG